ncbi:MAG: ABC transporter substrate-binding protein [Lachnospiraceae bacterium]|nr:ABC transporter substrate-binding protein [Lachnospiraceae bacterium]
MKKKFLALLLTAGMTMSLLAGCGSTASDGAAPAGDTTAATTAATDSAATDTAASDAAATTDALAGLPEKIGEGVVTATPEMYSNIDLSDPYTVKCYLIGDTPADWDEVLGLINDYLKPFNTSLEVNFMSWSDYSTMYSLTLTGGDVDLIFTAPWCYMYTEAAKGSFYTLDADFIAKNMPLTNKYQAPESWDETTLSGKTIAVPSNTAQPMGKIVAIRQDIADKYNISALESWDDYKNYVMTVAEKETPESGIYALAAAGDNNELWDVYREQTDTFLALDSDWFDMIYEYNGSLPTSDQIQFAYEYDAFRAYAKDMKEMADAGAWSRSALTNTVTDDDAFGALQGASIAWNGSVFTYMRQAEQTEGVTCNAYDITKPHLVGCEAYSNNDMAIAASTKNAERTAMVLDIMKMDTYVNHLILLGEEGKHYTINDNNEYTKTDASADYAPMTVSASWAIKNGELSEAGGDEREKVISDSWEERVVSNPTITFVFDDTAVANEKAAVNTVLTSYVPMLELGLVDDVDATLDQMLEECYASGLQTVLDEFKSQYDAWYATR